MLYREKVSGAQAHRQELLKLLKNIIPGDVVTVTRIDRLAHSTFDLFAIGVQKSFILSVPTAAS